MTTPEPEPAPVAPAPDREARGVRLSLVLLALTVVSGLIDAISYLGLGHVFTANMTGNVVILGFAAAGAPGFSVRHTATSLAFFLAGAATGGRVVRGTGRGSRRTWTRITLACEAVLLTAASAVAFVTSEDGRLRVYVVIALTAFAMGLRNATVQKLAVPALSTTTVVTMTLTGLASDSHLGGGTGQRSRRRAAAVTAMFAGAVLGAALALHHGIAAPLLLAAAVSGVLALLASGKD
ncbi:YoaK family protein [Streptomyces sp. NPDC096132]|uniref:YoaK family protein n=1 Tax=Streptomyces sp. NPDC096132 TaxID=3366075 RepID=UPI00382830D5